MSSQNNAVAVIINDVHFTLQTLDVATNATEAALGAANELGIPLVIAGDLLDGKALMRGEIVNRLINIFNLNDRVNVYILVGNHDLLNEKGEGHTLNFLAPYCNIIQSPVHVPSIGSWLFPYFNDKDKLQRALDRITNNKTADRRIIMHQGVMGAEMGHYIQDKTSLPKEAFANFRVISGHYHKKQDIKCCKPRKGSVGLFSYTGTPYTTSFGEANDGPKGFHILYEDGSIEPITVDARKHIIEELKVEDLSPNFDFIRTTNNIRPQDILWLKVHGPYSELQKLDKREIGMKLLGHSNYKLDKIPTDAVKLSIDTQKLTGEQILDSLIDEMSEEPRQKDTLKKLWREIL